ncbi:MAG TPA: DUF934 domain-containing protein [Usitatibacter sp.]|nr:DUF934 domain-containing protein [Usitatibacter sp.]
MPDRVIRDKRVENDLFQVLGLEGDVPAELPHGPILVPLATWKARRAELAARREPAGVWLRPDEDPAELAQDVASLHVIGVHFPKWGDGRGFSTGTLLRGRYDYRGELRAFGDLGRDHLLHLTRCGFDVVKLGARHDPEKALAAFDEFSVLYQGAIDEPLPLFRRRVANVL